MELAEAEIDAIIQRALAEDLSHGDITTGLLIPPRLQGRALVLVKARGILAGGAVAKRVFLGVDPALEVALLISDGERVKPGDIIATVSGRIASILGAERTALNFLQRLSGIATATARYVSRTKGVDVKITDTRKTTPGLRMLEKYAVRIGGGKSHRAHLGDGILIKDNHLAALRALGMSLKDIVAQAKKKVPRGLKVEVEVSTIQEAREAAEAGADVIMLDNMSPEKIRRSLELLPGGVRTEASGGITLADVRQVALSGVDTISIGALTHSVKSLDISLELEAGTLKLI